MTRKKILVYILYDVTIKSKERKRGIYKVEKYLVPEMDIVMLETKDIISTSGCVSDSCTPFVSWVCDIGPNPNEGGDVCSSDSEFCDFDWGGND